MSQYRETFPPHTSARMAQLLKYAQEERLVRRILCIYLRSALDLSPTAIAQALNISVAYVSALHSRYLRLGEPALGVSKELYLALEGKIQLRRGRKKVPKAKTDEWNQALQVTGKKFVQKPHLLNPFQRAFKAAKQVMTGSDLN